MTPNMTGRAPRSGSVSVWLLFTLSLLILAFMLAINSGWLGLQHIKLQTGVDAAAFAGGGALVNDERLRTMPDTSAVASAAVTETVCFAERNWDPTRTDCLNLGDAVIVQPGDVTISGDLDQIEVLGHRTQARENPVRIFLGNFFGESEFDVLARATVVLDRNVVGFRAFGGRRIPLMPIGLSSDNSMTPATGTWEQQTAPGGNDVFTYDPSVSPPWVAGPDTLFEMTFEIDGGGAAIGTNAFLLRIGPGLPETTTFLNQVTTGLDVADLPPNGQLLLDPITNVVSIPLLTTLNAAELTDLANRLSAIRDTGEVRIWPLVVSESMGSTVVHAFVAARIANVQTVPTFAVTIQPAMIAAYTAITEVRNPPPYLVPNPYVVKVRLAQ